MSDDRPDMHTRNALRLYEHATQLVALADLMSVSTVRRVIGWLHAESTRSESHADSIALASIASALDAFANERD